MTFARSRAAAARDDPPRTVPGALVVGGAHVSIAIARSLGRRGIPVWLLADHPLPRFSRYVERSFAWPGPEHRDGVTSIVDIASRHGLKQWVLFSTGDENMRMIAQNRALLASHIRVPTMGWEVMQTAYDKRLTYERAAVLEIDHPWSFQPRDLDEVGRLSCRFPVVLKPACRDGLNEFTYAKAWKADDHATLVALYRRAASFVGPDGVIIQEWIPGDGESQFSYAGLWNHGEPVASLVARRVRQHPVDFGRSSTFVETVEQNQVEALACRFLKSLGYSGVAEIEFKYDRRDRRFKLLDVNGRFWTWTGLGRLAGVDFPYLAWQLAAGQAVAPIRGGAGVAWMHVSRDIVAAWQEISRGTLGIADYLAGFRQRLTFASLALDDPLPLLVELPVTAWARVANWSDRRAVRTDTRLSVGIRHQGKPF
jgi:D-aspartate ligase